MAKVDTKDKYFEGIGRRKTATARVRLYKKDVGVTINDKTCKEYFKTPEQCQAVTAPFDTIKAEKGEYGITVKVSGSGLSAQAEAVRHGLARALVMIDEEFKSRLRRAGFLTRDSRMVERKKPGLKKARKAPQWSKR
ncbi:TPA: 30S ribosomal protein S9 [Patescibacteria group bacterium]|jgi:small subunit ribosomal protein S9|nr:30S ribosomal protein S9 [Patescibacteria group bacterium]|tara:strand:+ start:380 stop:790 length:411 start_codon:yes stop_codon:yes gene_type:complete